MQHRHATNPLSCFISSCIFLALKEAPPPSITALFCFLKGNTHTHRDKRDKRIWFINAYIAIHLTDNFTHCCFNSKNVTARINDQHPSLLELYSTYLIYTSCVKSLWLLHPDCNTYASRYVGFLYTFIILFFYYYGYVFLKNKIYSIFFLSAHAIHLSDIFKPNKRIISSPQVWNKISQDTVGLLRVEYLD